MILERALPDRSVAGPPTEVHEATPATSHVVNATPACSLYSRLELSKERGSESIRLLELLPGSSGEIAATLSCVASPRDRKYDALSYCWGQPTGTKRITITITVNGQGVPVSANLHDALTSLRLPDSSRLLWVDALCINQGDDAEKAAQVSLMGAIYRQAEIVVVFFGMPKCLSYPFLDFLDRDAEHAAITQDTMDEVIAACGMDKIAILCSVVEFCSREWWTRVWVMQEHYLAVKEPRWYIGRRYIDGEKLSRDLLPLCIKAIQTFPTLTLAEDISFELRNHTIASFADMLCRPVGTVRSRQQTKPHETPRFFFAKHSKKATNPRDYVYGMRELLEPHFRQVFFPDYTISEHSLFERLAAWLLLMDGWGDMLWLYPFRLESGAHSASWAPDFSRRVPDLTNEPVPPKFPEEDLKMVHCAIVDKTLYIDGCHLDVVDEVFQVPSSDNFNILQSVWRLERVFCSNQCETASTKTDWSSRAMLAWASSLRPATVPLVPRWPGLRQHMGSEFRRYNNELTVKYKRLLAEALSEAKTSSDFVSVSAQERLSRIEAGLVSAHTKDLDKAKKLYSFLLDTMEGDFVSACAFDFENLASQLQTASAAAPEIRWGVDSILPPAAPGGVVYGDLIRAIQDCSDNAAEFQGLASVVIREATKIHESRNHSMRQHIEYQKTCLRKLEEARSRAGDPAGVAGAGRDDADLQIDGLKNRIESLECTHTTRALMDEEMAALFRGRQFFCTRTGLLGLASPDVRGIEPGDRVVLLDGLSFPLVARSCGESRLAVVGCANVRGVKLHHKCEDAELPGGILGSKRTLMFV